MPKIQMMVPVPQRLIDEARSVITIGGIRFIESTIGSVCWGPLTESVAALLPIGYYLLTSPVTIASVSEVI
jgi:hypothetical protein